MISSAFLMKTVVESQPTSSPRSITLGRVWVNGMPRVGPSSSQWVWRGTVRHLDLPGKPPHKRTRLCDGEVASRRFAEDCASVSARGPPEMASGMRLRGRRTLDCWNSMLSLALEIIGVLLEIDLRSWLGALADRVRFQPLKRGMKPRPRLTTRGLGQDLVARNVAQGRFGNGHGLFFSAES